MATPQYPLINGDAPDFASLEVSIVGDITSDVKEISWKDTNEGSEQFGTSRQKISETGGQYKAEGSITLYKHAAIRIRKKLGNGWMKQRFNIIVNCRLEGFDEVSTAEIIGCKVKGNDRSASEGTDALVEKWDLNVFKIREDGVDPIPNMR